MNSQSPNGPAGAAPTSQAHFLLALPLVATALAMALGIPGGSEQPDSVWYRYMAEGQNASVIQPFASRALEPSVVRLLDHTLSIAPDLGFAIVASLSLSACLFILLRTAPQTASTTIWVVAVLFLPTWTTLFHAFLLPDIFHAALLAAFCLLLKKNRYWEAALMFIPLYAARESTALVLAAFLIAAAGKVKLRIMAAAVTSTLMGLGLEKWLALGSQGNRHQIPQAAYLIGKVPFNIMKNILGFAFWSNTFEPACNPTHTYALPHWPIFGAITTIGPCQWQPWGPATTLLLWLGTFGILPAALLATLWGRWKETWKGAAVLIRFCLLYGLVAFAAGPALGASVCRLVAYGWPAFALALPTLAPRLFENRRILLTVHLLVGWLVWAVFWKLNSPAWILLAILTGTAGWLFTVQSLRINRQSQPVSPTHTEAQTTIPT